MQVTLGQTQESLACPWSYVPTYSFTLNLRQPALALVSKHNGMGCKPEAVRCRLFCIRLCTSRRLEPTVMICAPCTGTIIPIVLFHA